MAILFYSSFLKQERKCSVIFFHFKYFRERLIYRLPDYVKISYLRLFIIKILDLHSLLNNQPRA